MKKLKRSEVEIRTLTYRQAMRRRNKLIGILTRKPKKGHKPLDIKRRIFLNTNINKLTRHLEWLKIHNLDKESGVITYKLWHVLVLIIIGSIIYYVWQG